MTKPKKYPFAWSFKVTTKTNIRSKEIIVPDSLSPNGGGNLEEVLKGLIEKINNLEELIDNIQKLKVGSIIMYSGNDDNIDDFLMCNGSAVSRETYQKLFNVIGTLYGSGDGKTTFNLPDLIGRFAEGSATPGTVKEAGLPNIESMVGKEINDPLSGSLMYIAEGENIGSGAFGLKYRNVNYFDTAGQNTANLATKLTFDASKSNPIYGNSDTVQPNSLTLKYLIKYQ